MPDPTPMTAVVSAPLGDALSYDSAMPVSWTPLAALPGAVRLEQFNEDNLRVLAAVALLDEQRGSGTTADENSPIDAEIARLNQKLNLVIDLLGFLVSQNAPAAEARRVRLSWQGLVFSGEQALGDIGLVSLRLNRSVPQPLVWPARIVHVDGDERHACFEAFGDALQTALERHVFLRHRRAIAGRLPVRGRTSTS
ncbi:PilZ domain-containing protein [Nevskia ramosa]|uniref:PilZ domain-containing protein n=1 Tax=Nevskia ramosa TaxID=64002 RepID=UPI002354761C|nr:PilZ domain-containing protein [Nevskia ramosa]